MLGETYKNQQRVQNDFQNCQTSIKLLLSFYLNQYRFVMLSLLKLNKKYTVLGKFNKQF